MLKSKRIKTYIIRNNNPEKKNQEGLKKKAGRRKSEEVRELERKRDGVATNVSVDFSKPTCQR